MKKNNFDEISNEKNVKFDEKTHADYLRDNVRKYIYDNDMTLQEFAEKADIPFNTLQSVIYKNSDCRLETAISIAKAIGIGLDELANTGAMPDLSLESVRISRSLPPNIQLLIRRYIRWQQSMCEEFKNNPAKVIEVMNLDYENDHLVTTNDFEKIDISEFNEDIKAKVFRGIRIPCEEYAEFYNENDILLLCDERKPRNRERAVILYYNRVYIVQKAVQEGVTGYRGIRSTSAFIPENEITYYFGYVAGVKQG